MQACATPIVRAVAEASRPDPALTVSQWADAHRVLSSIASSEPGRWRTDRAPYQREIMDALSVSSPVTRVVFMAAAQIGKTEIGNNFLGYAIAHAPGPMLMLMPTDATAEDNVRTRIDPLIETTPAIRDKVPTRGSKDGGNTGTRKDFPGGMLSIRGANAPSKLRSLPIRYLLLDEIDAYETDLGGEGDPVSLAEKRTATFGRRRKVYYVSTPTIEGRSRIASLYEATDQRRYFVPCPHCSEPQTIEWSRVRWDSDTSPPYLVCEHNGCVIEEREKGRMLAGGEWRATADCSDPPVRGYHLSALYSPLGWYSWAQARDDFLKAKRAKDPAQLKTWVNTVLGEVWREQGEAPPWEALFARSRAETYERNTVPAGGVVLTAACDVQRDRLEVEIRAWGERLESWSIDHRVIAGDPLRLDGTGSPWPALTALLSESWPHELGGRLAIEKLAVDSGDGASTNTVYNWCRKFPASRVMAVKGSAAAGTLISPLKLVDVDVNGQKIQHGVSLTIVGVNLAKSELYGWLRQAHGEEELAPTGWMHWPPDYAPEFFEQLCAEQLVKRTVKGYSKYEWVKTRERNEALDLAVYNRACAASLGLDRWESKRFERIRQQLTIAAPPDQPQHVITSQPVIKRRKSSYWD